MPNLMPVPLLMSEHKLFKYMGEEIYLICACAALAVLALFKL